MKQNILILSLLLILSTCENDIYYLSIWDSSDNDKYRLDFVNRKKGISDKDLFYFGSAELLSDILLHAKDKYYSIREENHPLVFMLETCQFDNITYFKPETVFVVDKNCVNSKKNYYDYTIFSVYVYFMLQMGINNNHYVIIAKELEDGMKIFFYVVMGINLLISIFLSFIMKRILRNMNLNNFLMINFLIIGVSIFLFTANLGNTLIFIFWIERVVEKYLPEFMMEFFVGIYEAVFYINAILILKGWMITYFVLVRESFKKYFIGFLLYEIFVFISIIFLYYAIKITSKLNILYIKNEIEQIVFLIYFIYCIIKVLFPLYKQMIYEQSLRSDLAECLKFKYKRLFKIYVLFGIHSVVIVIAPLIEKEIIYAYFYNYLFHYSFYLFYEVSFCLVLNIILIVKQLPANYFNDVVYNHRRLVNLEADIYKGDDKENHNTELNISNLSSNYLKKISKKDNYPIILIDPFASSKNQLLFNHIHIGIAQKNQD